jgi:hypothetical protein
LIEKLLINKKSSFLARKYLHFWRENIFVFGAKISSFLARKYHHFWRENIFVFGAKISSFLARKYLHFWRENIFAANNHKVRIFLKHFFTVVTRQLSATTFSITTLSITVFSIMTFSITRSKSLHPA